jgi:hypothetical protein
MPFLGMLTRVLLWCIVKCWRCVRSFNASEEPSPMIVPTTVPLTLSDTCYVGVSCTVDMANPKLYDHMYVQDFGQHARS